MKNDPLHEIAAKAIEHDDARLAKKSADEALVGAYYQWRLDNDMIEERVERDTPEWTDLLAATSQEYRAAVEAKRLEANAKRRLRSAIARYRKAGGA